MIEKKPWTTYIKNRIKNNKNFICFIGGPTGSGKSWSSLSIAEELDDNFDIDRCVFKGEELMQLVNSGKLKSGSVIVFEEAGIDLSNRNWQSLQNKVLNYLFQTFRHKRFILIMNSPYMDFIDKATRKLFHAEFFVETIERDRGQTVIKPQLIQYNSRRDKFYYKYLRCPVANVGLAVVKKWRVDKPSVELIEKYEEKKNAFTKALNAEILASLQKKAGKEKKPEWLCSECGHEWISRSKKPSRCPKCENKTSPTLKEAVST